MWNLDEQNPILSLCRGTFESNVAHWSVEKETRDNHDYSIPDDIQNIKTKGDSVMQPILDMEEDLTRRLRRTGKTALVLPGEAGRVRRRHRRRSELITGSITTGSGSVSLKKDARALIAQDIEFDDTRIPLLSR